MAKIATIVVLSLIVAAPAAAAEPASKRTTAQDQTKYCIEVEAMTGSRISKMECRTKAEWAQLGVDVDEVLAR
jgi:hypothetical protein